MDYKNLTEEDREELVADSAKIAAAIDIIVGEHIPVDMSVEKVTARAGMILMLAGATRTATLGAATAVGMVGPLVGLTKAELLSLVEQVYDITAASPHTKGLADLYAERNAEAQIKQFMAEGAEIKVH